MLCNYVSFDPIRSFSSGLISLSKYMCTCGNYTPLSRFGYMFTLITNDSLQFIFICSVSILRFEPICTGCAFLKYETKEQAIAAIEALNGVHKMEVNSCFRACSSHYHKQACNW